MNDVVKKPTMLLLLLMPLIFPGLISHAAAAAEEFTPVGTTEYRAVNLAGVVGAGAGERRRLTPFQLCLVCKCCSGATCLSMPCCFGIDCHLPNKPFGVCAFVPKTCNCTSCPS